MHDFQQQINYSVPCDSVSVIIFVKTGHDKTITKTESNNYKYYYIRFM